MESSNPITTQTMKFCSTLTKTKVWKPDTDISGSLYKKRGHAKHDLFT